MKFNSLHEKFIFYTLPTVLFTLLPFFLITGPFLSDLSVSLICILFLLYCVREKNFSYFKNKYFYFFLFFCGYLILNSLINNLESVGTSMVYVRYGIFVIAIGALLSSDDRFIKYFFYCILICFTVLITDGFYQYFVGENILGYRTSNYFRVSSFFHDELILGSYLSRLWPIFFGLSILIFKKENKFFLFLIIIFIFSEALIFLSGERSAFFYINLSAVFVILFSHKLAKLRLLTLLSSIFVIALISFINPLAKERIIDQSLRSMNIVNSEQGEEPNREAKDRQFYIFTKAHHDLYTSAYMMFLDNKIIGVGVKNFRNVCSEQKYYVDNEQKCSTHPHNAFIQILAETGLIGLSFLLVVVFYFFKYILKHLIFKYNSKYYFTDFEICILSGIIIYLWPIVPTLNFFNNWINIAMIINIPFLIWSRKLNKS